jgi:hypothetical protein
MIWLSASEKLLYRVLRIKPSPLREGNGTPFIFVHINKTAGTSVGRAVGLPVKHHLTAREIIRLVGRAKWLGAWKFTFVRNPWDRAASLYKYRRMKDKTGIASNHVSFAEWVSRVFTNEADPHYHDNPRSFQTQCEWLKDEQGAISIDFIGRFENINRDFEQIAERIAPGTRLPFLNASRSDCYRDYYNTATRKTVANWFAEDIDYFDYRFE